MLQTEREDIHRIRDITELEREREILNLCQTAQFIRLRLRDIKWNTSETIRGSCGFRMLSKGEEKRWPPPPPSVAAV